MEIKNKDSLENKLNELPPEIQEKVRELAGLAGRGKSSKIFPFERRLTERFGWISFLVMLKK